MIRNMTLLFMKQNGSMTRTVAPDVMCASRLANQSSRLYPLWSHNSSVAKRCAMIFINRKLASVALTYHMPLLSAATRNDPARRRASPNETSSIGCKNPLAESLSKPSLMLSMSLSRYK